MIDEVQGMKARLDRLESLVGTCMNDDGTVIPALLNAMMQPDSGGMRHEIEMVVNFLRENRP